MSKPERVRVTFVCESEATLNAVEQLKSDSSAFPELELAARSEQSSITDNGSDWIALTEQTSSNTLRLMLAAASERLMAVSDTAFVVHPSRAIPSALLGKFPTNLRALLRPLSEKALRLFRLTANPTSEDQSIQKRSLVPAFSIEADAAIDDSTLPDAGPRCLTTLRFPADAIHRSVSASRSESMETRCIESGLLLLHDYLDESHAIAQTMEGRGNPRTADYWHGLMHRREPDAANASWWFRRVGRHPAMDALGTHLITWMTEIGCSQSHIDIASATVVRNQLWDPAEMIRLSTTALQSKGSSADETCRVAQYLEMLSLLAWSVST